MDVLMPQLGETVAEGKVAVWFKQPGDAVEAGENLFEIETDKVTMEVQALASGVLSEVRVRSGDIAPVGAVVAVIGEDVETHALVPSPLAGEGREGGKKQAQQEGNFFQLAPFAETNTPTRHFGKATDPLGLKITPLARRLIAQNGIDLAGLAETVRSRGASRIKRADVEAALRVGRLRPSPLPGPPPQGGRERAADARRVRFNSIRRQTAERLTQAWQTIPHVLQAVEIDFSAVDRIRLAKKDAFKTRHTVSLTYLPFIARAATIALADFPRVNARLEGDSLMLSPSVNLGFAVDLAHEGLVVPVLKNATEFTVVGLALAIARLVERARSKSLTPDDFVGGTYTISNNGSFGTLFTAPIVNPPQVAILSTDAMRKRPVVIEGETGDSIAIHPVGIVAQSFDHRAFDGAYSAAFLARLKQVLENHSWAAELT